MYAWSIIWTVYNIVAMFLVFAKFSVWCLVLLLTKFVSFFLHMILKWEILGKLNNVIIFRSVSKHLELGATCTASFLIMLISGISYRWIASMVSVVILLTCKLSKSKLTIICGLILHFSFSFYCFPSFSIGLQLLCLLFLLLAWFILCKQKKTPFFEHCHCFEEDF